MKKIFTLILGVVFAMSAMADTIDITYSSSSASVTVTDQTSSQGWWEIVADDETTYYVYLCAYADAVPGVYTAAELTEGESFIGDYETGYEISFTEGSISVAVSNDGSTTSVTGSLFGDDGNTYNLFITHIKPTAETTINVTFTAGELDDEDISGGIFYVSAEENDYTGISLIIEASEVIGSFTEVDLLYPSLIVGGESQNIYSATITIVQNTDGSYTLTGDFLCYNNIVYHVVMTIPAAQGIEDVVLTEKAQKVVVDGAVYIVRDNKLYNMRGMRVR